MKNQAGCVVQGNVRRGTELVLKRALNQFERVVFVTWEGEPDLNLEKLTVLKLKKPLNTGLCNRNLQRLSASTGVKVLKDWGCNFVMKWRSDMFIEDFQLENIMKLVGDPNPEGVGRIIVHPFRVLNVAPDFFSSISDYFAFGRADDLLRLWSDEEFDLAKPYNVPPAYSSTPLLNDPSVVKRSYAPEAELYAWYRYRLEKVFGRVLCHDAIVRQYFVPSEYYQRAIFWFGNEDKMRSVAQAFEHPWYNSSKSQFKEPVVLAHGYPTVKWIQFLRRFVSRFSIKLFTVFRRIEWNLKSKNL
jgi:hypothetical protein